MKETSLSNLLVLSLLSGPAFAYDGRIAQQLDGFYQEFSQETLANSKLIISAVDFYRVSPFTRCTGPGSSCHHA